MVASDDDSIGGRTTERRGGFKLKGRSQHCDKEGHVVRDCSKMKVNKAKGKSEHAAVVENIKYDEDDVLAISSSTEKLDWILDLVVLFAYERSKIIFEHTRRLTETLSRWLTIR